jgi:hypothetical protein
LALFSPPIPNPPLEHKVADGDPAAQRDRERLATLAIRRQSDPAATWRTVALGTDANKQAQLIAAMRAADVPEHVVQRTEACCAHAFVWEHEPTHRLAIRTWRCHNRFCLLCQRAYLRQVRERTITLIPPPRHLYRFLTLTIPAKPGRHLRDAIRNLRSSFRRLRETHVWQRHVVGGLYIIEATRGTQEWWHAHLHAIIDARFMPLDQLQPAWAKAIDGPPHVHIETVWNHVRSRVNNYLSKYLSKAFSNDIYDHPQVLEDFVRALRGTRLCMPFGKWTGNAITAQAKQSLATTRNDIDEWRYLGELHQLIDHAETGSLWAANILRQLGYPDIQLRCAATNEIQRWRASRSSPKPQADQLPFAPAA